MCQLLCWVKSGSVVSQHGARSLLRFACIVSRRLFRWPTISGVERENWLLWLVMKLVWLPSPDEIALIQFDCIITSLALSPLSPCLHPTFLLWRNASVWTKSINMSMHGVHSAGFSWAYLVLSWGVRESLFAVQWWLSLPFSVVRLLPVLPTWQTPCAIFSLASCLLQFPWLFDKSWLMAEWTSGFSYHVTTYNCNFCGRLKWVGWQW